MIEIVEKTISIILSILKQKYRHIVYDTIFHQNKYIHNPVHFRRQITTFFVFWIDVGAFIMIGGQVFRSLAMYTAGSNFHHQVRDQRDEKHKLVTSGIYSHMRHPSYFGWFWYSVGGQIVLGNPICLVGYVYVLWKFFEDRIVYEEVSDSWCHIDTCDVMMTFYRHHWSNFLEKITWNIRREYRVGCHSSNKISFQHYQVHFGIFANDIMCCQIQLLLLWWW